MITALLITAAYAIPAVIARKRKMGFAKGLLYSLLLTPLVAIPVALLNYLHIKTSYTINGLRRVCYICR